MAIGAELGRNTGGGRQDRAPPDLGYQNFFWAVTQEDFSINGSAWVRESFGHAVLGGLGDNGMWCSQGKERGSVQVRVHSFNAQLS